MNSSKKIAKPHYKFWLSFFLFSFCLQIAYSQSAKAITVDGRLFKSLKSAASVSPDSVYRLSLKGKKLKEIPPEVFQFKNLRELDLTRNRIEYLPNEINQLKKLEKLNLSKNRLKEINPQIGACTELRWLDLGKNELTKLPDQICLLEKLEYLQLWANEITSLPTKFYKLKNIRQIDMRAIIISESEREEINDQLPKQAEVLFSPPCNCGK